jgi:hypothetical protein
MDMDMLVMSDEEGNAEEYPCAKPKNYMVSWTILFNNRDLMDMLVMSDEEGNAEEYPCAKPKELHGQLDHPF